MVVYSVSRQGDKRLIDIRQTNCCDVSHEHSECLLMSLHLDEDLLRTFLAVADSGNFTHAALRVGRTQSAVSMQIKRLEEAVDAMLFERGARGVSLTNKGSQLLGNARRIVGLLDETAALFDATSLEGKVSIGIHQEYAEERLANALHSFDRRHPGVEITVRCGTSEENLTRVQSGDLDLAVIFDWQGHSDGEVLMVDPTVWVTSEKHLTHERRPVPIALFRDSAWSRDFAIPSLESCGVDYRVAFLSAVKGGLRLAVTSGLAISPISRSDIPPGCRELTADEGFAVVDHSNVVLVINPSSRSAAVAGMAEAIREAFAQFPTHAAIVASGRAE
jgi:DNA-binding transcriptional LysR family regulator